MLGLRQPSLTELIRNTECHCISRCGAGWRNRRTGSTAKLQLELPSCESGQAAVLGCIKWLARTPTDLVPRFADEHPQNKTSPVLIVLPILRGLLRLQFYVMLAWSEFDIFFQNRFPLDARNRRYLGQSERATYEAMFGSVLPDARNCNLPAVANAAQTCLSIVVSLCILPRGMCPSGAAHLCYEHRRWNAAIARIAGKVAPKRQRRSARPA